jgi:WD40 repeat protein
VLPDLESLVADEPLREDWWRLLMLALYRAGRQADALAAGRRARAVLADELGSEPGPGIRRMEAAILAQDPALELVTERASALPVADIGTGTAVTGTCPFMGLATYQVADAPLFHGRTRLVTSVVARLVDSPVLVVSGPSGAGKSSAVRAGLVPALAAGALPGSAAWAAEVVTPGRRPVDVLAGLTGESPPAAPVLLVCDQFEELWAAGADPAERAAFLDAVLGLLDDGIVVRCVVVVRGDHVGRLAEHAGFAERLGAALVLVPALTDAELRETVREPACAVGLSADPELLDAVVSDVVGRVGALPLLSTALVGTWERRRGAVLTLAGYLESGGVAGALTRSAETAYAALDGAGREAARPLLVRLADVDDGGSLVRHPIGLAELELDGDLGRPRRRVVDTFVGHRLLAIDGDRLDVAHEALFTAWPRLATWLDEDSVGRSVRRHLAPAAHDWHAGGRPADELYRGARLAAALDWAASPDAAPTSVEEEFLAASQQQVDIELQGARDQIARERRARHRTRRLAVGLAAVLVVALVAAVMAVRFQRAADTRAAVIERNSVIADATRLAALSAGAGAMDVSLLLAVEAVRLADTPQTQDALLGSLLAHHRAVTTMTPDEELLDTALGGGGTLFLNGASILTWPVGSGIERPRRPDRPEHPRYWYGWEVRDASPTQDLLVAGGVTVGTDKAEHLWVGVTTPDGGTRYLIAPGEAAGLPFGVSFTGDGRRVNLFWFLPADADSGREQMTWGVTEIDVADGAHRDTGISGTLPGTAPQPAATISDDGRRAVVYDDVTSSLPSTLVDLVDGHQVHLQVPARAAASTGFRALSSGAAQLWADGAVTLYGSGGRPLQQVTPRPGPVRDVVAAPDGTWAATVGGGGAITLWDVDAPTSQWVLRESFAGHAGDVIEAHITADSRLLVTRGADNRIIVWDVTEAGGFGTPVGGYGDRWLAGPPEVIEPGQLVVAPTRPVSDSVEGEEVAHDTAGLAATFLEPGTGRVVDHIDVGSIEVSGFRGVPSMAVSPNGRMVAISTGLSTTVLDASTRTRLATIDLPPDGDLGSDFRPLPADEVNCVGWTPDSARVLLCSEGDLVVVKPNGGEVERHVPLGGIVAQAIATSPDGRRMALADLDSGLVLVLDARTLEVEKVVDMTATGRATDISFSPDGRRIAVTGSSRDLYLVDTTTWEPSRQIIPVGSALLQAEWLPDNRTVALGSSDGTVSLFDSERQQLRGPPVSASNDARPAHVHLVPGISDELVAMSGERPGRSWSIDPRVWFEQACTLAGRVLSRAEWTQYLPDRPYRPACAASD